MHGSFYPDPFLQFLVAPFLHTAAHNFCIFAYCSTRLTSERSLCLIPVESLQILYRRNTHQSKELCCEAHIGQPSLALFPGLLRLHFWLLAVCKNGAIKNWSQGRAWEQSYRRPGKKMFLLLGLHGNFHP